MTCEGVRQLLGEYSDGEVPTEQLRAIESHVAMCLDCAKELASIRSIAARFNLNNTPKAPVELWNAIDRRLEESDRNRRTTTKGFTRFTRYVLAAGVVLLALVGGRALFRFEKVESAASASTVDFGILLDDLPRDAVAAFEKFLSHYRARPVTPADAKVLASHLNFDIPPELPGGFRLEKSYLLQFGGEAGIAARYSRNGEFLGAIFHRPVQSEEFGTHRDYECVVGKHRGHAVAVGRWKLVHLTDASTCHCVLSQLDEGSELPLVMSKLAPNSSSMPLSGGHAHDHHP